MDRIETLFDEIRSIVRPPVWLDSRGVEHAMRISAVRAELSYALEPILSNPYNQPGLAVDPPALRKNASLVRAFLDACDEEDRLTALNKETPDHGHE